MHDAIVIKGVAPAKPNVVSDGGLKHAGRGFAYGTFGTWEPGREWAQITPEELSFARPVWDGFLSRPYGILLAGIIPGVFNSSTRAELAGLISALAKPIALHIALDNKSVADRACAITEGIYLHRKPWRLLSDGDLWCIVAKLINARGPDATRISWTKGHAGWQWIASQTDNATTVANGQADFAASKGAAALGFDSEVVALDYHARKMKAYESLVARLQVHAAKLIMYDKQRREEDGIVNEGKNQPVRIADIPDQPSRCCFTEGAPLAFMSLPPECAIHDISTSNSMFNDTSSLHVFWSATRWRCDPQARPTTWLELFALFRLWGGGPRDPDPHLPRPPLMPSIKAFTKASKALFKIIAEGGALEMLRPAKGKAFHLAQYGMEVHLPAVRAELCLEAGVATTIHNMLSRIRLIKQGEHKGKLKASAAPLPKKEPWFDMLAPGPTPLNNILNSRRDNLHNNIMIRGERGDHRELKPQFFYLSCPSCSNARDCAHVKLFTTTARGLTCSKCKKSTSSTRWCCEHGTPWTRCPVHRETGFRCGARSLSTFKGSKSGLRQASLKALKGRQAKLSRLGSLGEPKSLLVFSRNSVGSHSNKGTLVHRKIGKRRGKRPTPKREGGGGRLGMPNNKVLANEYPESPNSLGVGIDEHVHDYSHIISTSRHWQAHMGQGQPEGDTTSHKYHNAGSEIGTALNPAKKARLSKPFSTHASRCRGNCPAVWTIESYCEACHG